MGTEKTKIKQQQIVKMQNSLFLKVNRLCSTTENHFRVFKLNKIIFKKTKKKTRD